MKESDEDREDLIDILEDLDERLGEITADVRHSDGPLSRDIDKRTTENEKNEIPGFPEKKAKD